MEISLLSFFSCSSTHTLNLSLRQCLPIQEILSWPIIWFYGRRRRIFCFPLMRSSSYTTEKKRSRRFTHHRSAHGIIHYRRLNIKDSSKKLRMTRFFWLRTIWFTTLIDLTFFQLQRFIETTSRIEMDALHSDRLKWIKVEQQYRSNERNQNAIGLNRFCQYAYLFFFQNRFFFQTVSKNENESNQKWVETVTVPSEKHNATNRRI